MKVLVFVCLAVQVLVSAVTVPPSWIKYQSSRVTTLVPFLQLTNSFYPKDIKPFESVPLQYRTPHQQIHILHPQNNEQHKPESYQIVHFDKQKSVPIISTKPQHINHNNKQHLTEVNPPVIQISTLPHTQYNNPNIFPQKTEQKQLLSNLNNGLTFTQKNQQKQYENNVPQKVEQSNQNLRSDQQKVFLPTIIPVTNEDSVLPVKPKQRRRRVKQRKDKFIDRRNEDISESNSAPIYSSNVRNPIGRKYTQIDIPKNEDTHSKNEETNDETNDKNEEINEETSAEKYVSEHEQPKEVPTKPNYPGEGQWAKYGQKHRPYIRPEAQHQEETEEQDTPEGYETFEKGQQQFRNAQTNFQHDIASLPSKISSNDDEEDSAPLYNKPELGYVPEKLYAQVRRTETVTHLPRSSLDPEQEEAADRLREVVKDSKIHTVYTEEGYEDTAYDHAGHEKQAENQEGYGEKQTDEHRSKGRSGGQNKERYNAERGRKLGADHQRRKIERKDQNKNADYEHRERYSQRNKHRDEETAASNIEPQKLNITTVTLKNNNQRINMEIHTEIKVTPQKKKHKFIKIVPSPSKENETVKRVKRYDKDELSKKYVRKRPSYYWKKKRTTTTERTIPQTRKNFEAAFKTHRPKLDEDYFEDLGVNAPKDLPELKAKTTAKPLMKTTTRSQIKPTIKPTKKVVVTTTTTSTTTSTTTTIKPSTTASTSTADNNATESSTTTIHPDLMNPELTTKANKPATPKPPPVKIRKFKVKRTKRYTNDFHKIQVDLKEFTDVDKIKLPPPKPDLTHIKYPYYNLPRSQLHEDSPLRYAEDMKNIPEKIENLSFYKSREHIKCPAIPNHVNPIPERIENQKEGEAGDKMPEEPDLPRLQGLGDKIDCMKIKYFGEDPLDSPFFKEDIIEQPVPFFEIKKIDANSPDYLIVKDKTNNKREIKIKILEPIVVLEEDFMGSATANPIHSKSEAVLKPPYTLQEMMTMQEKLTPKSIYDQISLLEQGNTKHEKSSPPDQFIIVYENQEKKDDSVPETTKQTEQETAKPYTIKPPVRKQPMVVKKLPVKTIKKPQPRTTTTTTTTTTAAPTTTPYTPPTLKPKILPPTPRPLRKLISATVPNPIAPKVPLKPVYHQIPNRQNQNWQAANRKISAFYNIFDISKFLPRVPDAKLISENSGYYTRPAEQMKMYSNVLQNTGNNQESNSKNVPVAVNTPEQPNAETKTVETAEPVIDMLPPTNGQAETIAEMIQPDQMPQPNQPIEYIYIIGMDEPEIQHRIVKRSNFFDEDEDLLMEETENKPTYTRPQYTEIRRARPSKPKESEEEEDLNPRKRIYELTSSRRTTTETPVLEEIEEIAEVVEEIPTTTPEPKIYPVEANKEDPNIAQYIFFVEKLHDKWAKEDATTTTTTETPTEKIAEAQQLVAETVQQGEPAYLQIINQLHEVRKEEEEKTSTTSTTTTTTTTEQAVPQKNSNPFLPDFMSELNNMKATLDSNAESSNVETTRNRNYSNRFRTSIDTSKYKTIERAPVQVRHNFSSRFNSENQELPLQKGKTTQEPMIIAIIRPQSTTPLPKDTTESSSNVEIQEESTTTVKSRTRGRFRGRGTTSTTEKPTSSTINPIHRRRRPVASTTTSTTTAKPDTIIRRRRPLQKIAVSTEKPTNHKEEYTPTTTEAEKVVVVTPSNKEEPKKQRRFQKVQERHIMSEVTLTRFYEPDSSEEDLEETKKHQYEVIGPLKNTDTLHGGNYKHEKDKKSLNSSEESPENYYTDSTLAENVNNLTEPEKKDLEKVAPNSVNSKIGLYPNMAKMVNRLADVKEEEEISEEETEKPLFVKDPSRRMYYYARL